MKIVAHSTVPANIPYLHVGYTAGCNVNPNIPTGEALLSGGITILMAGLLLGVSALLKKAKARLNHAVKKVPRQ